MLVKSLLEPAHACLPTLRLAGLHTAACAALAAVLRAANLTYAWGGHYPSCRVLFARLLGRTDQSPFCVAGTRMATCIALVALACLAALCAVQAAEVKLVRLPRSAACAALPAADPVAHFCAACTAVL